MLTGADLLAKVKELGDVSKSDMAKACGYVSTKKDGGERINFTSFYEALLNAKGVELGGGSAGVGKGGRKLSYKAVVQGNGNLLVGKAYTAMLDLQPGDEFTIKLSKKKGVSLIPSGAEDEEGEE
ncbi:AbrB-like transcriptional regulator involved in photosynthesis regulation [Synechococcus sp. A18-25c]|uniref:AbrB family transcriptional regulator n=1 Tax=unclassified Synechococcus TaxID=2626047 RepID=UPI000C5EE30C|nr:MULTISPECIES: AbrB family transcriptional regulator [unclassified Synechococcus]MAN18165.1 AbrB family transcriptional regulator [Synechococcus sp. EAC657]MEC7897738.1 AbrB family transcriptional regulator [Cyanobacteriota bacterium]QNI47596.1 AbrB-like transcriptional regulator involved in photosynthesis regulation [Synechococcus sp. A15-60]QNJ19219.1 AbrB-like transcriptional regulator involved in photosynthesis regulation [Synechococcus sp. A18-25c]|tara:strand:- start:423 stop:797 length:375 start_codon:yes stop_codon:yes gene_type:complete